MKERPILFSAPMVRAILDGTKTQTRRVVKLSEEWHPNTRTARVVGIGAEGIAAMPFDEWKRMLGQAIRCPYGQPGDRLYVKEKHAFLDVRKSALSQFPLAGGEFGPDVWNLCVEYCDGTENDTFSVEGERPKQTRARGDDGWRPSIHMPRWASRILLEITAVRVERLNEISRGDAMSEGCPFPNMADGDDPRQWFSGLWQKINGGDSWSANPWVWVVEFRRIA